MSKKMKWAYSALGTKDYLTALSGYIKWPTIIASIIGAVSYLASVPYVGEFCLGFVLFYALVSGMVWLCDLRIRALGFSEVSLERMGLA